MQPANIYKCPECGTKLERPCSCEWDKRCPSCDIYLTPFEWEALRDEINAGHSGEQYLMSIAAWDTTGHEVDYYTVEYYV
jgi:hypothetical protein